MARSMGMVTATFLCFVLASLHQTVHSCSKLDRDSLMSFRRHISAAPPLNWSEPADCCRWEGVACASHDGSDHRVTHLRLPEKHLSGTITPSLRNLSFLSHLNLSHNCLSAPLPLPLFPLSIKSIDLSSNLLNGSIDDYFFRQEAPNLIAFNISNNSFSGSIPLSVCKSSPFLEILDFSMNKFSGSVTPSLVECRHLRTLRAGSNSLSGSLPNHLYDIKSLKEISLPNNQFSGLISNRIGTLSNLTVLELHMNSLNGELPPHIGLLSNLKKLQLHDNGLNGTLPPSLMECSGLKTLILRNNRFGGEISNLNFSKLRRLEAVDLGNNSFVGGIPESLCFCRSLLAMRLAYNQLIGEIPTCMSSLKSLRHLSLANNTLSDVVGALKILSHCENLSVLFLWGCFDEETELQRIDGLHEYGFRNLQYLTMGRCRLKGPIPFWISKLSKLRLLDVSRNNFSGGIPSWFGDMSSLFSLNLTQNRLTGGIPPEIGRMPAMVADNASNDLVYLALPYVASGLQYSRLLNIRRVLGLGSNGLSGGVPPEIGRLKLLQVLDISNNNLDGGIPVQMLGLTSLEALNMSRNRLSGEIPVSMTRLHFLSSFSVAYNDLGGEIPRGGQFDTFAADSFEGNPKLCGVVIKRNCPVGTRVETAAADDDDDDELHGIFSWYRLPFGLGYSVGFVARSCRCFLVEELRPFLHVKLRLEVVNHQVLIWAEVEAVVKQKTASTPQP